MREAVIKELTDILRSRRSAAPEASYVASLFAGGIDGILRKIGEEATELMLAAKDAAAGGNKGATDGVSEEKAPYDAETDENEGTASGRDAELVHETADLWFHCMVLLVHQNQDPQWVLDELRRRLGVSGHEEKARRASGGL